MNKVPYILCIETSTVNCSVALVNSETGVVLDVIEDPSTDYSHGRQLHLFVQKLLKNHHLSGTSLQAISVSAGPGSYTGLRIGISAAKGLCLAWNMPLISVSTLRAIAAPYLSKYDNVIVLQDARRMEVFAAIYGKSSSTPAPLVLEKDSFKSYLRDPRSVFVGSGVTKFIELAGGEHHAHIAPDAIPSASQQARIASEKLFSKNFENLAYFEPEYIKQVHIAKPKSVHS